VDVESQSRRARRRLGILLREAANGFVEDSHVLVW
jgi:hypothetical protein